MRLSGFPAWLTWLLVHLWYLIGFQNRLLVLIRWSISFFTKGRGARLIAGVGGEIPQPRALIPRSGPIAGVGQSPLERRELALAEEAEARQVDLGGGIHGLGGRRYRDRRRLLERVAVDAAGDGREGDRAKAEAGGDLDRRAVRGGQQFGLLSPVPAVDRADRVDDPAGRQPEGLGRNRLAGGERAAGGDQLVAGALKLRAPPLSRSLPPLRRRAPASSWRR